MRNGSYGSSRRDFVRVGTIGLGAVTLGIGCGGGSAESPRTGPPATDSGDNRDLGSSDSGADAPLDALDLGDVADGPTPSCEDTDDNILGPYYRTGAPSRSDLVDAGMAGVRVTISGRVLGHGCKTPLASAVIDVWQADDAGAYDDGIFPPPKDLFRLRGKQLSDAAGRYAIKTLIPGHYLNGAQYRPSHVHVRVSAPGYVLLTTQLYFAGDKYNAIDPYIKPRLIMALTDAGGGAKAALFDFVLAAV